MCVQNLLHKVVCYLIENHAVLQTKHMEYNTMKWNPWLYVHSIVWKTHAMVVCMQYACPYGWNTFKNKCHLGKKWKWGWTALKDVLHFFHLSYFSARMLLAISGKTFLGPLFEEVKLFIKKWSWKEHESKAELCNRMKIIFPPLSGG